MQAIVLAGGRGQRLWPESETLPKPMIEILGKPILYHHLAWLASEGVRDVIVACGYRENVIITSLTQNPVAGLNIRFVRGCEPLGRGGAIKKAAKLVPSGDEPAVVSYADIISNIPLHAVWQRHYDRDPVLTLVVVPYRSPFGIVEVTDDGCVSEFREKPQLPYWINSGIFVASREFLNHLPEKGEDEETTIQRFAKEGRVITFQSTDHYWHAIDTQKDLMEVERDLSVSPLSHMVGF